MSVRFINRSDDSYAIGTGYFEILSVNPESNAMWLSSKFVFRRYLFGLAPHQTVRLSSTVSRLTSYRS